MLSETNSITFHGIDVAEVKIQVQISSGLSAFILVGLADKTIAESKERVRAALNSLGLSLPAKRILVNLAPANIFKEGSHFDLAIASALLIAMEVIPNNKLSNYIILGELSLNGSITDTPGVLPAAVGATALNKGIICPKANGNEAIWSGNSDILAPDHLISLINHFKDIQIIAPPELKKDYVSQNTSLPDLLDIKGLENAKRAIEIAAAGGHNLLMCGPPGAGKSMLASRLPSILPPLSFEEILQCSMIYSIAGLIQDGKLQTTRPFRAPHHSCSLAAMVGGGFARKIAPGEISLAHNGVLFLDEFPEFPRVVIDSLRQPIENREVLISRVGNHITLPAKFQLIAAMNPCRCGYLADESRNCNKAPKCAFDYQAKISGPIMDRIDIYLEIPELSIKQINTDTNDISSASLVKKINQTRTIQKLRYQHINTFTNSELTSENIEKYINVNDEAKNALNIAAEKLKLSMRSYYRVLKVARTIADLSSEEIINKIHIAEALSYRRHI